MVDAAEKKGFSVGEVIALIIVVPIIAGVGWQIYQSEKNEAPVREAEKAKKALECDDVDAFTLAQDIIKTQLKHPLDADFAGYLSSVVMNEKVRVAVKSSVKAKNGFGAALTYPYIIVFDCKEAKLAPSYVELDGEVLLKN